MREVNSRNLIYFHCFGHSSLSLEKANISFLIILMGLLYSVFLLVKINVIKRSEQKGLALREYFHC